MIRREHDRKPIQVPALAPILAMGDKQLLRQGRVAEVLWPHGEPRHIAWHQRIAQVWERFDQRPFYLLESFPSSDTAFIDLASTGLLSRGASEDLDAGPDLPRRWNADC